MKAKAKCVIEVLEKYEYNNQGIYLDLGAELTDITEYVEKKMRMHYIGISHNEDSVKKIIEQGYEAYVLDLSQVYLFEEQLKKILNGKEIGCIALTNILEATMYPEKLLEWVCTNIKGTQIPVVMTVYNAGQDEVIAKYMCDKVENHGVTAFNEKRLLDMCEKYGLHMVEKNDIKKKKNDQSVQRDVLPMMSEASFSKVVQQLRNGVSNTNDINQMIRLFIPGPRVRKEQESNQSVPFLSIITRTTGNRIETLKEVLLCLTGQECTDFEVLIMGHNVEPDKEEMIKEVIQSNPKWMKEKIRFIKVEGGNRSTPLNSGFAASKGQYITILDDDDIVFANWVQAFKKLSIKNYGKILKSVTVRQEYEPVQTRFSQNTSRAVTGFIRDYPSEFDFLQMLHHNQCPGLCLAFPSSVFKEFGLRFDETLNTIEDWDFIMRAVFLCDVASSPEITNIYRWWRKGESSQTLHKQDEWEANYHYVQEKLNSQYMIVPPGNMKRIVHLIDAYNSSFSKPIVEDEELTYCYRMNEKRWTADQLLHSNSWKITKPLRGIKRLLGKKTCIPNLFTATEEELDELIANIYGSKSWKMTACFRRK